MKEMALLGRHCIVLVLIYSRLEHLVQKLKDRTRLGLLACTMVERDQPWLRLLLGMSVAPQVGSIFN